MPGLTLAVFAFVFYKKKLSVFSNNKKLRLQTSYGAKWPLLKIKPTTSELRLFFQKIARKNKGGQGRSGVSGISSVLAVYSPQKTLPQRPLESL